MKNFFLYLTCFLIIVGCGKEININLPESSPKIVINCLFTDSTFFKVYVSKSVMYLDTSASIMYGNFDSIWNSYIDNALVQITEKNQGIVKTLPNIGYGLYIDSLFKPLPGNTYLLKVSADGFVTVYATSYLPSFPKLDSVRLRKTNRFDIEFPIYSYNDLFISMTDPVDEKNYYELLCSQFNKFEGCYTLTEILSDEPFITSEGDRMFTWKTILFSDELINGKSFNFKAYITSYIRDDSSWHIILIINSLTEDLYRFNKSLIRNDESSSAEFFEPAEPVPMYTNIKNGYGIFAGYRSARMVVWPEN